MDSPVVEYLSAGANRHTAVGDWSGELLAFGADINVALWQPTAPSPRGIITLLRGHKDVVKAVKFLPTAIGLYLVTGGDDQTLKLWRVDEDLSRYECIQTVHEHSAPVNCIAILKSWHDGTLGPVLLASGGADATIKIWLFESGHLRLLQSIETAPKFFPLALALSSPNQESKVFILAAAGTKDIIQIFTASSAEGTPEFKVQATLSGHEGWIRSLDFTLEKKEPRSDLLLASASQDKYIRVWRLHEGTQLPALSANAASDPSSSAYLPGKSPSNKAHRLKVAGKHYSVTFEALLLGHEDWIYSAKWNSPATGKPCLLSTSADNSLAMWEPDPASGIWVSVVRLGEISREKGGTTATGSIGGFWTGLWRGDGKSVVCLGRTGSWRRWDYDETEDQWRLAIAVTGHTKSVTGISWSKSGSYLLSTSSDQTTRLHTTWTADGRDTWHEMSRPQIHGYDLNCIDSLGDSQFVSGADEKLMRVFSEPKAVAKLLNKLGNVGQLEVEEMPDAANIPVLGLSNKAIDGGQEAQPSEANGEETAGTSPAALALKSALDIDRPPFEDSLSRYTLWPEIEKLYGHGYEISCLAVSHDGRLIASACKASSANHAVIRLFETRKWTEVKPPLTAHSLTATRLRFSHDDKYLLSVGRDRQWAVFERDLEDLDKYSPLQANPKGHSRMILDAAWAPCEEKRVFATAGRDKQVKIWSSRAVDGKLNFSMATSIPGDQPVTAVDFLPTRSKNGQFVLAVGSEGGKLTICSLNLEDLTVASTIKLKEELCPSKAILQLAWRPLAKDGEHRVSHELAIAGDDSSLRIYSFRDM